VSSSSNSSFDRGSSIPCLAACRLELRRGVVVYLFAGLLHLGHERHHVYQASTPARPCASPPLAEARPCNIRGNARARAPNAGSSPRQPAARSRARPRGAPARRVSPRFGRRRTTIRHSRASTFSKARAGLTLIGAAVSLLVTYISSPIKACFATVPLILRVPSKIGGVPRPAGLRRRGGAERRYSPPVIWLATS
jgi:hypothetical protein